MKPLYYGAFLTTLFLCWYEPVQAEESTVDFEDVTIRYIDEGQGAPVLLVHGFLQSADSWRRPGMIDALVDAGYRAIALDNRGHGASSKPHDPAKYGMKMVHDIGRLLDHLNIEQTHFIGYSMGSRLISSFCNLYPNRCLSMVLGGYASGRPSTPYKQEDIERILRRFGRLDGADVVALAATRPMSYVWKVEAEEMKRNSVPTLLLVGDQDDRLDLTKAMPNVMRRAKVEVVSGNHGTAFSSSEFVKKAIAFVGLRDLRLNKAN